MEPTPHDLRPAPPKDLRVIVAPAKRMVHDCDSFEVRGLPHFLQAARQIVGRLGAMGPDELQDLWKCSDALARGALEDLRRLEATCKHSPSCEAPDTCALASAVTAYRGIQYQHMAPQVMSSRALDWIQGHLRIVSGLYGVLRPFDGISPYRLEMQARLTMPCRVADEGGLLNEPARNLYEFWGTSLARELERTDADAAAQGHGVHLVNLASVEYANAVLPRLSPDVSATTCIFLEPTGDGRRVQRASASKAARGTMVRWLAEEGITNAVDLRGFNLGGYRLDPEASHSNLLVFVRREGA